MDDLSSEGAFSQVSAREGFAEMAAHLGGGASVLRLYGCEGGFEAAVIARAAIDLAARKQSPLVVITPDEATAQTLRRDLEFFLSGADPHAGAIPTPRLLSLPAYDTTPWADLSPDRRAIVQRMSTLFRLSQGLTGDVLVAPITALARRVIPKRSFASFVDIIQSEQQIDRDHVVDLLQRGGYVRAPVVEDPGSYAVRGGVLDVFVPLYKFPLRIELFGDEVESIKIFDPTTQRTMRAVEEIYLHPVRETILTEGNRVRERLLEAADLASHPSSKTRSILEQLEKGEDFFGIEALTPAFHAEMVSIGDYLPKDVSFFMHDLDACMEALDDELEQGDQSYQGRVADQKLAFSPGEFYLDRSEMSELFARGRQLRMEKLDVNGETSPKIRFRSEEHGTLRRELEKARAEKQEELLKPLATLLRDFRDEGTRAMIVVPNLQHAERLESLLKGYLITPIVKRELGKFDLLEPSAQRTQPEIILGTLGAGFRLPLDRVALIAEAEIFGERATRRDAPKAKKGRGFGNDDFKNLESGAYVVHTLHGVGIYKGLVKLPLHGTSVDFLHLEYEGGAIYLPVWRLSEVQPYSGAEGLKPKLDRLGGLSWEKTRSRVTKEIRQMAEELIQLYAQRRSLPGHSFSFDTHAQNLFREFEATFPFEETPDQQRAIDEVLGDLDESRPMDRLVCGDVGYGKTEVAIRAAMKVVLGGKQAAVLAPTTVLVEQHALTFAARCKNFPINVASISRFSSRTEQLDTLKRLGEGKVDIIIGTHRLLSSDVRFKDLGLLVIDEEQRFGVTHKEKLKKLRTQVDVLTMSATPIPRTLNMALMGLREISIITTPPADRLAIRTLVGRYSDALVVEGVRRELGRGGQVFFVHNRVEDIHEWAKKLRELLPDIRLLIGHGQMPPEELEKVMVDFVDGRADVLLCTTIIESGLDIPRANTMFVNQADRFGLAQLYQLRGRIGRSRERAFCYLLIPPEDSLSSEAKQRLSVLQRFTELGAGFSIASHDLEIRGAGDLLGAKQSGMIAAVGFDTYTALLEEAVASLKGEPIHRENDPELSCDLPGFIPEDYCPDIGQRLEFYRRLSVATNEQEVGDLVTEIIDRFGPIPDEVRCLADIMIVKALGRRLRARAIELTESRLSLTLGDDTPLQPGQVMKLVSARLSPWKLTPDMRLQRAFAPGEKDQRLQVAQKLLTGLLGTVASA